MISSPLPRPGPQTAGAGLSRRVSARDWLGHGPATPIPVPTTTSPSSSVKPKPIPLNISTHPLFSYHAEPVLETHSVGNGESEEDEEKEELSTSFFSDPGVAPSNPIQIDMPPTSRSRAPASFHNQPLPIPPNTTNQPPISPFSPASAFLSHFSPSSSIAQGHKFHPPSGSPPYPDAGGALRRGSSAGRQALSPPRLGGSVESAMGSINTAGSGGEDSMGATVLEYTLGKVIGRGGFSTVRLATHQTTGEKFACRIVKRDDLSDTSGSLENFELELALWNSLPPHPSLLPLLQMHRTSYATYLISPYLSSGSLLDILKRERGSEGTARRFFSGVVAAVAALHEGYEGEQGGVLHGDLKLDNFLVGADGRVVLCDFGLARRVRPSKDPRVQGQKSRDPSREGRGRGVKGAVSGFVGSSSPSRTGGQQGIHHHLPTIRRHQSPSPSSRRFPTPVNDFPSASLPYAPPELLSHHPPTPALSQDIWALGIVLHALLTSRLPFVDAFDPRLIMKIIKGDFVMPAVGEEWQECLRGLLEPERERRWDVKRLMGCDAVMGWRRVRSKSRSRSRVRTAGEESRRQWTEHPVYTPPEERGRRGRRSESRERRQPSTSRNRLAVVIDDTVTDSYFRGNSGSRSRSRGRGGEAGVFPLEVRPEMARSPSGGGNKSSPRSWENPRSPLMTHEEAMIGPVQVGFGGMSLAEEGEVEVETDSREGGRGGGRMGGRNGMEHNGTGTGRAGDRSRSRTRKGALGAVGAGAGTGAGVLGARGNETGRVVKQAAMLN